MEFESTELRLAQELDSSDELKEFRNAFLIRDPNTIYLDGNSLGRLPKRTLDVIQRSLDYEWGERLIRSWNESWMDAPTRIGAKIAQIIGAQFDEVIVTEATSINLFKLVIAALEARPGRLKIISDTLNFPSDIYILQGVVDLLGNSHRIELIPSRDGISISLTDLEAFLDQETALVCLTHVAFKSAFMYDMASVTEKVHQAGALMLWDLSHSVGAVPIGLNSSEVDLAVGCTYKYLNGGPGAPAFLYVRSDLQDQLIQPIWGWFASRDPFAFDLDFKPADGLSRYRVGTLPMLSLLAIEPAVDLFLEAGIDRLRAKSVRQCEYLVYLAENWLAPLGFTLGSPRSWEQRGSHVSLQCEEAFRICKALIESPAPAVKVIPDFRSPDNIRLGIAPLYTTYIEIYQAMARIRTVVENRIYEKYTHERLAVT